jgi:hypothetical protein
MSSLLKNNPELAKEWHPTENAPLTPKDLTLGSNKKVWWVCTKGHEWQARVTDRNYRKTGCPYCSGYRVCIDNCLDTINPTLASQWHPTKNDPLTPKDVTPGSTKRVWWTCTKGHEWEAVVHNRNSGTGCPYCAGRALGAENNLQAINPELAKQWDPKRNGNLTPTDVTPNSDKKAWWICVKGHEWEATISNRNRGRGCPYCAGRTVGEDNCLQTVNPPLAGEWHSEKNGSLTPRDVMPGSSKRGWWRCEKGHEWEAIINSRSKGYGRCPYCSGRTKA